MKNELLNVLKSNIDVETKKKRINEMLLKKDINEKREIINEMLLQTPQLDVRSQEIINDVINEMLEKDDVKTKKMIVKEMLLQNNSNEMGYVFSTIYNIVRKDNPRFRLDYEKYKHTLEHKPPKISKAMPRNIYEMGKKYSLGFPSPIMYWTGGHEIDFSYNNEFFTSAGISKLEWDDLRHTPAKNIPKIKSVWQKDVKRKIDKLNELTNKVKTDKTGKYDKPGIVSIPRFRTNSDIYSSQGAHPQAYLEEVIDVECTQRELIEAGILPEDILWKKKQRITPQEIAEADKEKGLTTKEVGTPRLFFEKIKNFFKGKDER